MPEHSISERPLTNVEAQLIHSGAVRGQGLTESLTGLLLAVTACLGLAMVGALIGWGAELLLSLAGLHMAPYGKWLVGAAVAAYLAYLLVRLVFSGPESHRKAMPGASQSVCVLHVKDPIVAEQEEIPEWATLWFDIGGDRVLLLRGLWMTEAADLFDFTHSLSPDAPDLDGDYLRNGPLPCPFPSSEFSIAWVRDTDTILRIEVLGTHLLPSLTIPPSDGPSLDDWTFKILKGNLTDLQSAVRYARGS